MGTRTIARRKISLPNKKPIEFGWCRLTSTGMEVNSAPSFGQYEGVGDFIKGAHQASGFWLADWLAYGETRKDWQAKISQAQDATGLSEGRLKNIRTTAKVEPSRRRDDVEFALHTVVAAMPPEKQSEWLEQAATEGWSERELRVAIRSQSRRAVIEGQATLEGMFRFIYADPAWKYDNTIPKSASSQTETYPGMSIEELIKLFELVKAHAAKVSTLAMWVTAPFLYVNPGPRDVLEAGGFTYKANFVWDKVLGNPGSYNHIHHEHLIIATRGGDLPDVAIPQPKSIFVERRSDLHSEKPATVRKMIEKHWTHGPYLELFAREKAEGWTSFGNDARLWAGEAKATR